MWRRRLPILTDREWTEQLPAYNLPDHHLTPPSKRRPHDSNIGARVGAARRAMPRLLFHCLFLQRTVALDGVASSNRRNLGAFVDSQGDRRILAVVATRPVASGIARPC